MLVLLAAGAAVPGCGGGGVIPGPVEMGQIQAELGRDLDAFEAWLHWRWNGSRHPVVFGGELLAANSHRGEDLLTADGLVGAAVYLDRLQQLGVRGVTIDIQFPILMPWWPRSAEYLAYYRALCAEVRRRGLLLHLDTGPIITGEGITDIPIDYSQMTLEQYLLGRREQVHIMARELRPNVLTFANEPSTESAYTGKDISVATYLWFVNATLSGLDRTGMAVGAGCGTWDDLAYVSALAYTSLDFFDLHVYPVRSATTDFLRRAIDMIDRARLLGKRIVIGEAWLYKARAGELGQIAATESIFARDVFASFEGLDRQFLRILWALAHWKRVDYVSPFWTKYLFSYVPYDDETRAMTPAELLRLADQYAVAAIVENRFSGTGLAYAGLIAN